MIDSIYMEVTRLTPAQQQQHLKPSCTTAMYSTASFVLLNDFRAVI